MKFKIGRSERIYPKTMINITSLMDVLTTLLFFMIQIFAVNSMNFTVPPDVELPVSQLKTPLQEAVNIIIGPGSIRTLEKDLVRYDSDNGKFKKEDLGEDGRTLLPLSAFLKEQMDKRNKIYEGIKKEDLPPGKLLIYAHKEILFKYLKYVLHTASVSGYGDYDFVVVNR